jgi:hypothetical protein
MTRMSQTDTANDDNNNSNSIEQYEDRSPMEEHELDYKRQRKRIELLTA